MKSCRGKKDLQGFLVLLLLLPFLLMGHQLLAASGDTEHNYIQKGEYWIDNRANGVTSVNPSSLNADSSLAAFRNISISTAGLSNGKHILYFRMQDRRGKWGAIRATVFTIGTLPTDNKMIAGQYYWGNNPAQKYSLTGTYNKNNVSITNDITAPASNGRFTLFTRFQDARGRWGATRAMTVVVGGLPSDNDISGGQYFWSSSPAQKTSLSGSFNKNEVNITNDVTAPNSEGVHVLWSRLRDARGKWGALRGMAVLVLSETDFQNKIVAGEYFWSHDPDNRIALSGTINGTHVELSQSITAPAGEGAYQLNVRFMDARHKWGPIRNSNVIVNAAMAPPVISQAEYYFDSDPGAGNGVIVTEGEFGTQSASYIEEVALNTTGLGIGNHSVYTRFMNNRGEWGNAISAGFEIQVKPQIIVSKTSLDFGDVVISGRVSRTFSIKNGGDEALNITSISIAGSPTYYQIDPTSGSIPANSTDSIVVSVTFISTEPTGDKNAVLTIENNDANKTMNLIAKSIISPTPTIVVSMDELKFGAITVNNDSTITFQVSNLGTNALVISNIQSSDNVIFEVKSPSSFPRNVSIGSPLSVEIRFKPTDYKVYRETLSIISNDPANGTKELPMSGEGTTGPPTRLIVTAPDSLDFGVVTKDSTLDRLISIKNEGNSMLTVTGITSGNSAIFEVINPPSVSQPLEILSSATADIAIRFKPKLVFTYRSELTIQSDATNDPTVTMKVKGRGVAGPTPNIVFNVGLLDFEEVKINKTLQKNFTISNQGNADLVATNIGSSNTVFTVIGPKVFTLKPGQDTDVAVSFTPTAAISYNAQLTVYSNTDNAALPVRGTGTTLTVGFSLTTLPEVNNPNEAVTINILPGSSLGAQGYARLFFKEGGKALFDSLAMVSTSGNAYKGIIPKDIMQKRGVAFYIKISDGEQVRTAPESDPAKKPYTLNVTYPGGFTKTQDQVGGTDQTSYRMISIPLNQTNPSISTVLANFNSGQVNIDKWRLFRWQSGKYVESSESGFQGFSPGRAYWFITTDVGKLNTGAGVTMRTDQNLPIDLQPGWNMIGSPFYFSIDWDDVVKTTNVSAIFSYNGSDYVSATKLEPWEGYFVKNNLSNPETIQLSPVESGTPGVGKSPVMKLDGNQWQVQLRMRSGVVADEYNFIGMLYEADESYDAFDLIESPRQPGEFLKLYFPHEDWGDRADMYGSDYRPINDQGAVWDFTVSTTSSAEHVDMDVTGLESLPDGFRLYLIDKDNGYMQNLSDQSAYIFPTAGGREMSRNFRLIAGTDAFISENDLGVSAIPSDYFISQNYPNPFNPTTTIQYMLPVRSRVTIKVFSIVGQEIKALLDQEVDHGMHIVIWDATNQANEHVANGLYFYSILANALDGSGKSYRMTRKMMLIK
jgi:hypothetical protein